MTQRFEMFFRARFGAAVMLALTVGLAGCAGGPKLPSVASLNPFKTEEKKHPGKRVAILGSTDPLNASAEPVSDAGPMQLPPAVLNESWGQPGGVASNRPGHLQLAGGAKTLWRVSAGEGSSSYGRLTAAPIVAGGRIYVLDAYGHVSAFSASGGKRSWRVSLAPPQENAYEGFGGGLAIADGQVIAATGFGTVVALNPSTGKKLWEVSLGAPIRTSPTAAGGKVFVVTIDGRFYAISSADGKVVWQFRGAPQKASILTNISPAVEGGVVVVPYLTGDVVAIDVETGEARWTDSVAKARSRSSLSSLANPSRPVIDGGIVYTVGNAGRMIASSLESGERVWSKEIRSNQTPVVAGDGIFVVDGSGRMIGLNKATGGMRWAVKLPGGGKWSGPVLAGGKLWVVSSKSKLVGVDATVGRVATQRDLGAPAYIGPIVAGGRMYVLTDKAQLLAFN